MSRERIASSRTPDGAARWALEPMADELTVCDMENGHRNSGFSHETWWFSIKLWKMAIEIVDLAINSMVDLSTSLCKRLPEGKGQMELGFRLEHVGPSILVGMPREMPRFIINHYYRAIFHSLCEFTGWYFPSIYHFCWVQSLGNYHKIVNIFSISPMFLWFI